MGLAGTAGLVCGNDAAEDVLAQIVVPIQAIDVKLGVVKHRDEGEKCVMRTCGKFLGESGGGEAGM